MREKVDGTKPVSNRFHDHGSCGFENAHRFVNIRKSEKLSELLFESRDEKVNEKDVGGDKSTFKELFAATQKMKGR